MQTNSFSFVPETVDEQIDRIEQFGTASQHEERSPSPDHRLIEGLHEIYQEDARIGERVWHQLSRHVAGNTGINELLHQQSHMIRRQERFHSMRSSSRSLRLIAAVFFAALLVGSLLWVLNQVGHRSITGGVHPAPSSAVSPIPQVEPPLRDSTMAYDPAHHTVLLVGGAVQAQGGSETNETWAWDGHAWRQLHPASSPPALQGTMVYDATSRRIMLFLNQVQSGGTVANEMWTWDGATWHQLRPAVMPEVLGASMAYDAAQHQIVLFGGEIPYGHVGTLMNTTWTWNGTIWQKQDPVTSPSPRTGAAMAYDAAHQQIVLYGGVTLAGVSTETWTWDGATWQQHHVTSMPPESLNALLVYDNATQQTLLFGGMSVGGEQPSLSSTWAWNGTGWVRVAAQGAPIGLNKSATYDDATQTVIVYAVQGHINKLISPPSSSASAPVSQTWIWNGMTWKLLP